MCIRDSITPVQRTGRARPRHRRHPIVRADGRAIRRHGQTNACWTRGAERAYGALLAQAGFTGIVDIFESPYGGFCSTFSRSNDRFNLDELSWELGRAWETMRISLKFYSCVGSNHTTLDAIRNMQNKTPFGADDITSIVVHGSQVTVEHVGWPYKPQGLVSALSL